MQLSVLRPWEAGSTHSTAQTRTTETTLSVSHSTLSGGCGTHLQHVFVERREGGALARGGAAPRRAHVSGRNLVDGDEDEAAVRHAARRRRAQEAMLVPQVGAQNHDCWEQKNVSSKNFLMSYDLNCVSETLVRSSNITEETSDTQSLPHVSKVFPPFCGVCVCAANLPHQKQCWETFSKPFLEFRVCIFCIL